MSLRFVFALSSVTILTILRLFGHGWTDEMRHELSAATPEWLVLGASIKAAPAEEKSGDQSSFRPLSGGAENTRDRVLIPSRGIEIKVDYPISWYRGCSLSPDGTKLIINSGTDSRLYQIESSGQYHQVELTLPRVTYDDGPKGFVTGWSWADNVTLIGEAEIDDEEGKFIERRIYVFHLKGKILSRLDVSALKLATTEGLTVSKVGTDLGSLGMSVGDSEFTVKADLKSSVRPSEWKDQAAEPANDHPEADDGNPIPIQRANPAGDSALAREFSIPWSLWVVCVVAALGLLWMLLKRRSRT